MWFQEEGIGNSGEEKGWVAKSQKFKVMYEAKLEFLEGWGVIGQIPSVEGYGYFLEPQNSKEDKKWEFTIPRI